MKSSLLPIITLLLASVLTMTQSINSPNVLAADSTYVYLPLISNAGPVDPGQDPTAFIATFDGDPAHPTPWSSPHWDITVQSRDTQTWQTLEAMPAAHGPNCEAPPATHVISAYEDTVYNCRNHVMTAIFATGYGAIYLTPDHMVDFSSGEAVIRFDISTLSTSNRDWVDVWVTPYEEQLQLPLDDWLPDLQGEPLRSVRAVLDNTDGGNWKARIYNNHNASSIDGLWWVSYSDFITPSAKIRTTIEIRLSQNHIKIGMIDYDGQGSDFYWVDSAISPPLDWNQGVVQFAHHSYNPSKACDYDGTCGPNTWHWDNITISPAIPFTIIGSDKRLLAGSNNKITLDSPAPADSHLRFAGIGNNIEISFNGGASWQAAQRQDQELNDEGHFSSYWTPIPAGVSQVMFRGQDWWGGGWHVRDVSVFSRQVP
jgi:hypothetical protein